MRETAKKIDIGYRIGKLTVAADTGKRVHRYTIWRCDCDCGNSIELDTRTIQRGTHRDCGCESRVRPGQKDVTGQRFGKLICIEPTDERKYESVVWRCRCDCGNTAMVPVNQLVAGCVKSCGCLRHPPQEELTGKRFGHLTVIAYAGKSGNVHRWRCRCDCGKETVVGQTLLQSGKTSSCGCLRREVLRENLKLVDGTSVTLLEARKNHRASSNTSGHTGVYRQKRTGKWAAQITFQRKTYYLGAYDTMEDAVKAREKGEEEIHNKFLRWYHKEEEARESAM